MEKWVKITKSADFTKSARMGDRAIAKKVGDQVEKVVERLAKKAKGTGSSTDKKEAIEKDELLEDLEDIREEDDGKKSKKEKKKSKKENHKNPLAYKFVCLT